MGYTPNLTPGILVRLATERLPAQALIGLANKKLTHGTAALELKAVLNAIGLATVKAAPGRSLFDVVRLWDDQVATEDKRSALGEIPNGLIQ